MFKAGEPADLDVLAIELDEDNEDREDDATGASPPPTAASRRRRWPGIALALCVLAAVVAFPVRLRVNEAAFGVLEQRWQTAIALQRHWADLEEQLNTEALPTEMTRAHDAVMALDLELASRFDGLRSALAHQRLLDSALRRLAGDERAALALGSERLRRHTFQGLEAGVVDNIVPQLTHERSRWHRHAAAPPASFRRLHAADATLAALGKWFDRPTAAVLVQATRRGVQLVDLDRQRTDTDFVGDAEQAIARTGYIAVLSNGTAYAVDSATRSSGGPRRALGPANELLAAVDGDAVWLVTTDPLTAPTQARRVAIKTDGSGRILARVVVDPAPQPPASLARVNRILGETGAGLVTEEGVSTRIHRLDGTSGPSVESGTPISVSATAVALSDQRNNQVDIWDPATGSRRPILNPPGYSVVLNEGASNGELSPDGSHLALQYYGGQSPQIAIVDVTTGSVSLVPGSSAWVRNFAWAPDGKTVFFTFNGGATHSLGLYRLGEPALETARATGLDQITAFSFTVLAAG